MYLTKKYPECLYRYTVQSIRAIEGLYKTGHLVFDYGYSEHEVINPIILAEFKADYERACKHFKIEIGKRAKYKTIEGMVKFLNGED